MRASNHQVRTTDEVWENAKRIAREGGLTTTQLITDFLVSIVGSSDTTWEARGKVRRRLRQDDDPGKQRSFRVHDDLWAKSEKTALEHNCTLSKLIVDYLEALKNQRAPRKKAGSDARVVADPKTCTHPRTKVVMDMLFCHYCGTRLKGKVKL